MTQRRHREVPHSGMPKTAFSLLLAAMLLTCQPMAGFAKASGKAGQDPLRNWPVRDFLPPIATINTTLEDTAAINEDNELETVALSAVSSPVLHASPKVDRLAGDLNGQAKSEQLQTVLSLQQRIDTVDLERLWQATVEKNPVIRFSLEKLATPADLQTKQSSKFLTKTLSTLISGAALATTMIPGGGAYRDMGTMAVGNALQNLVQGKTQPTLGSLSATEQIQLAGLIDELKMKLIHTYQDYKNTLQSLAQSHETTLKHSNLYSKALASKNDLTIMAAGTAYYQALSNETVLRQKAKLARLELERLAGPDSVSDLELAVRIPVGDDPATASLAPEPVPAPEATPISPPEPVVTPVEPAMPAPLEIEPSLRSDAVQPLPLLVEGHASQPEAPEAARPTPADASLLDLPPAGEVPQ